jgi:hypothetical protein
VEQSEGSKRLNMTREVGGPCSLGDVGRVKVSKF